MAKAENIFFSLRCTTERNFVFPLYDSTTMPCKERSIEIDDLGLKLQLNFVED